MSEEITRESLFPNGAPGTSEWKAHVKEQRARGRERDEPELEQEQEQAAEPAQEQAEGQEQAQASDAPAEPNQPIFNADPNSLDYQSSVIRNHEATLNAQKQELVGFAQMVEQQVRAGMDPQMALSAKMEIERHAQRIAQEEQALGAFKEQHRANKNVELATLLAKRHPELTNESEAEQHLTVLRDWLVGNGRDLDIKGLSPDRAAKLISDAYQEFKAARRAAMSESERHLDDLDQKLTEKDLERIPPMYRDAVKEGKLKLKAKPKSKVKQVDMKAGARAQDQVDGGFREPQINSSRGAAKPALDPAEINRSVDSAKNAANRAKEQGLSRYEQRRAAREALGLRY